MDLFQQKTRIEQKRSAFAIAKRWAERLPGERGESRKRCYALMKAALMKALRT